ncbi:uncharacterized protein EV422DRAFT_364643 [Fimicolochytrium jonesii]|uniref:uncharacterized protein n=1 Tax=Fimicolochytrium jonesii TaxID=1396493 RepID=UPI0022FDF0CA|nr:uncharacterized protein EV422DRAFT_364643 [Fimicolochytrium jonesii]KAI8823657.1 hypothetical protein EV422DRAFT_364643 [Fimicolochytrium jonesii]
MTLSTPVCVGLAIPVLTAVAFGLRQAYLRFVAKTTVFIDEHYVAEQGPRRGKSAVVCGGSFAGMAAARVLLNHFDHVTVLESEALDVGNTDWKSPRKNIVQASALHILQPAGFRMLERLFPGIRQRYLELGVAPFNVVDGVFSVWGGVVMRPKAKDVDSVLASRTAYEAIVRAKLLECDPKRLNFKTAVTVQNLVIENGRVQGVTCYSKDDQGTFTLNADLVVDATGRSSKGRRWLKDAGYPEIPEESYDPHIQYVNAIYEMAGPLPPFVATMPRPGTQDRDAIFMTKMENNLCYVATQKVADTTSEGPKTDEEVDAIFERVHDLWPFWKDLRKNIGRRVSDLKKVRVSPSRFVRYDLIRNCVGFVVVGDAFCSFNPIYGQGMTTAAMAAVTLSGVLRSNTPDADIPTAFHSLLQHRLHNIWLTNQVSDLAYDNIVPCVGKSRTDSDIKFMSSFSAGLFKAAHIDVHAAAVLCRSTSLVAWPHETLHPQVLWAFFKALVLGEKSSQNWEFRDGQLVQAPSA